MKPRVVRRKLQGLRERALGTQGLGKREWVRRLAGLGLSRHDDPELQREGVALVARFLAWMRQRRCVVSRLRRGDVVREGGYAIYVTIEAAHLTTRGAYGSDLGNTVPLAAHLHAVQQHDPDYFAARGVDPVEKAREYARRYLAGHPADRAWLLEHATDGDVIALCRDVESA